MDLRVWSERMLSVLRVVAALMVVQYGFAKLFGFPHVAMFDNLQLVSLIGLSGVIELVGGALLLVGVYTRIVAFIIGRDGLRLFHVARAARLFPDSQWRRVGRTLLLLVLVFRGGRGRRVEPRSAAHRSWSCWRNLADSRQMFPGGGNQ